MSFVEKARHASKPAHIVIWHAACCGMNKRHSGAVLKKASAMINKLISPRTTLEKAIVLSIAAMLGMNVFVLTQQFNSAPTVAAAPAASAALYA